MGRSRTADSRVAALTTTSSDRPCLLVVADGSTESTRLLVWALREAARREATVLAVAVLPDAADEDDRAAARLILAAQVHHAVGEAGVRDVCRTALLDPLVFDALAGAVHRGADLVVVGHHRKAVLRRAVARPLSTLPRVPFVA